VPKSSVIGSVLRELSPSQVRNKERLYNRRDPAGTDEMTQLQRYVERYGELAGPKLYHALQSRAGFIGSSRRRGREIEALTGRRLRKPRPARTAASAPGTSDEPASSFPVPMLFSPGPEAA
jgi:hypothetical protein